MASFKAIYLSPSVVAIDADSNYPFTWQVQGGLQVAFELYIYNNSTDALVYDSGVIVSSKQSHIVVADTLTNGIDYKWYVSTNTIVDDPATFISSEYEFFTCTAVPVVTFEYPTFDDKNCVRFETFDDDSDWTPTDAADSENTVTYKDYYGTSTIDLYSATAAGSFYMAKTTDLDLTVFNTGASSTTLDYIRLVAYADTYEDQTIYLRFTSSNGGYFYHTFDAVVGWVYSKEKSTFSTSGSPSWNDITEIKVGFTSTAAQRSHVYFQALEFYKVGTGTDTILNTQDTTFYLGYSQTEEVGIKKYKLKLYDEDQGLITDTGWLYDLLLNHEFTGMVNGSSYYVEGIITSQYDQEGTTGLIPFEVSYQVNNILPAIETIVSNSNGTVTVDWSNINFSVATITGDARYATGMFNYGVELLSSSANCTFSHTLPETYTITYWIRIENEHDGDFMQIGSDITIGYDQSARKFYYNNNGSHTYSAEVTIFSFTDFGTDTWETIEDYTWIGSGIDITGYLNEFLFVGVTTQDLIIKKSGDLIAHIEL